MRRGASAADRMVRRTSSFLVVSVGLLTWRVPGRRPNRRVGSGLHPWILGRVGVHGGATVLDGVGPELVVPGFVTVDLAQPVRGAVFREPRMALEGPMSTASPDTCADVVGVATHRAASCAEPYSATASWSSRSWYSGERQPLSTRNATPAPAAAVAARRRARSSAGSSLATAGTSSSKTVVPLGTAPSASPSALSCAVGRTPSPCPARHGAQWEGRERVMRSSRTRRGDDGKTRPSTTTAPAMGSRARRRSPR